MYEHYATFSFPTHTRVASRVMPLKRQTRPSAGRKVRLASSPHFSTFQQPYGLKQNRSVPPAMLAA